MKQARSTKVSRQAAIVSAARRATIRRQTRETDIALTFDLDGSGRSRIATGIGFLDHMLTSFATHGRFDLDVTGKGDLHVDAHHSVEDVGIALGDALMQALGDKKGIVRFGHAYVPLDEALSRCVVDLTMPTELFEDFFWALADRGRLNIHLETIRGRNAHHIAETLFKSAARALSMAVARDPRVTDIPSTKGVL
jgi:imidazoleglycerol-phosphate dehydratase